MRTSAVLLGVMLAYWAVMIHGIRQIKVGLSSEKLFLDDSPLLELVRIQTNIIFKEGGQVLIACFVSLSMSIDQP